MMKKTPPSLLTLSTQDVTAADLVNALANQSGHRIAILDPEGESIFSVLEDRCLPSMLDSAFDGEVVEILRATRPTHNGLRGHICMAIMLQPEKFERVLRHTHLWGEGLLPRLLPIFPGQYMGGGSLFELASQNDVYQDHEERVMALFQMKAG